MIKFPEASDLTTYQKIKVLEVGYTQFASELQHAENLEHKVAISSSTIVLVMAGLILQQKIDAGNIVYLLFSAICFGFSLFSALFLFQIGKRKQLLCAGILRIEQILGFFTPGNFVSEEFLVETKEQPHKDSTVFMKKGLSSGYTGLDQDSIWHMLGVGFCGIASGAVILVYKFY